MYKGYRFNQTNTIAKVNLELSFLSASSVVAKGTIDGKATEIVLVPGFDKSTKKDGNKTF